MDVTVTVNGTTYERDVEPRKLLIHFLRDDLDLTGSHIGCDTGNCGACSVIVDGTLVKSCMMLAVQADGASVETVEGLADGDELSPLQQGGRAHQHPGGAVAALEGVVVAEGLLERRQLVALREPLDGLDARAVDLDGEQHAALHEPAVEDDAARAAVAGVAADVAAGQVEVVAEEVDEEAPRVDVALVEDAVDGDGDLVLAGGRARCH